MPVMKYGDVVSSSNEVVPINDQDHSSSDLKEDLPNEEEENSSDLNEKTK